MATVNRAARFQSVLRVGRFSPYEVTGSSGKEGVGFCFDGLSQYPMRAVAQKEFVSSPPSASAL
jgi:hypothetical protein